MMGEIKSYKNSETGSLLEFIKQMSKARHTQEDDMKQGQVVSSPRLKKRINSSQTASKLNGHSPSQSLRVVRIPEEMKMRIAQ